MTNEATQKAKHEMDEATFNRMQSWRSLFSEWTLERKETTHFGENTVTTSKHWKRGSNDIVGFLNHLVLALGFVAALLMLFLYVRPHVKQERFFFESANHLQDQVKQIEAATTALSNEIMRLTRIAHECDACAKRLSATEDIRREPIEVEVFMDPCRRGWFPYRFGSCE